MIPEHIILDGGMVLSAITTDRFKTACLSVSAAVTADKARSPLDTLLLGVLGRGNATYPTLRALNRRMDHLYDLTLFSRNYRMGDLQILGSGAYFLDPAFLPKEEQDAVERENVKMLMESLYAPLYNDDGTFLPDYVRKEETVQCDVIRDEQNQPTVYAEKRSRELTFSGEPHGVSFYGTEDGVRAITEQALTDRYRSFWPHAPLRFFYVGSTPAEKMAELIDGAFRHRDGTVVTDGAIETARPTDAVLENTAPQYFEESMPISQGRLVMLFQNGTTLASKQIFTAMVYNEILGGSPISKLFVNVREKKSLCYYCSSIFDFYKGYFSVSSGIRPGNRAKVETEILRQVDEMRRGHVSREEMDAAVRYLLSVYTGLSDSASAIENYYLARSLYGVACTPEECKAGIAAVTREDVIAFAENVSLRSVYFLNGTRTGGNAYEEEAE